MKKIIITFLLLLSSTSLFCQAWADGIIKVRMDREDLPYRIAPISSPARNGKIWRPLKGYLYWNPEEPRYEYNFRYDTKGVLQQESMKYCVNPLIRNIGLYNQTFTKEGFDFLDTITYYQILPGTDYIPDYRIYYDYHYYDRYPQDSFYYIEYTEGWNNITQEWEMRRKKYESYFDTTLFVIRERYAARYVNGEWVKEGYGTRILREYDEDGLVTSMIIQDWNFQTGEYEIWNKHLFFYDEDNIHIETHVYYPDANDWKLRQKLTDIEYTEWYPNSQPGMIIEVLNGPEKLGIADKRVKEKSYKSWELNDEWKQYWIYKHDWNLNGTKSHIDTAYRFYDDAWHFYRTKANLYNERGDFIQRWVEGIWSDGTFWGEKSCFFISYHPEYDECESEYVYDQTYQESTQSWDSVFMWLYEYFDWWDVTQPVSIDESAPSASVALSIFPNPVSGMVIISAESEIEQLHIFDITGRLVASPSSAGERVVFDTGVLPQGVYLVRALLKDGGVRTGKVVVH